MQGFFYYSDMQPLRDTLLIKADKARDKTASGLLIQEDWKTLPPLGTVLAVGPDVRWVAVGDRVMFERYGSIVLENNERLCKEAHLMAIMTDVPTE